MAIFIYGTKAFTSFKGYYGKKKNVSIVTEYIKKDI